MHGGDSAVSRNNPVEAAWHSEENKWPLLKVQYFSSVENIFSADCMHSNSGMANASDLLGVRA
jgi:hypothetical protein